MSGSKMADSVQVEEPQRRAVGGIITTGRIHKGTDVDDKQHMNRSIIREKKKKNRNHSLVKITTKREEYFERSIRYVTYSRQCLAIPSFLYFSFVLLSKKDKRQTNTRLLEAFHSSSSILFLHYKC